MPPNKTLYFQKHKTVPSILRDTPGKKRTPPMARP